MTKALEVLNLDSFDAAVQGWFAKVENDAIAVAKGLAYKSLNHLLKISPQYSGDFVANWKLSMDSPDYSFQPHIVPAKASEVRGFDGLPHFDPYQRGDQPAMDIALTNAAGKLSGFKLGRDIYLSNSAYHLDNEGYGVIDRYGWKIEKGVIKLRPVNAGATHVTRRTSSVIGFQYRDIGLTKTAQLRGSFV